jgi:hypothetical protein
LLKSCARAIRVCIARIQLAQPCGNDLAHLLDIARIEVHVRIAGRMDVAERAVDHARHLQLDDVLRCLDVARRPGLDAIIAALREEQRQPADLELGSRADDEVGVAHARDEARPRLDAVRVLLRRRRRKRRHLVAAQLLRERGPFRLASKHIEGGGRGPGGQRGDGAEQKPECSGHVHPQNVCAPCAPRLTMYCRNTWLSGSPMRE